MKKTYITPITEIEQTSVQPFLTGGSGGGVKGVLDGSSENLGYGGVDEEGNLDPSANNFGGWDDDSWDEL